jgi:hypothetical protein
VDANLDLFRSEIAPSIDDWKSIDMRIVALRSADGWNHGIIRIVLDSSQPANPNLRDLPDIEGLLLAHKSLDIKEMDSILESLSVGEIEVDGEKVNLKSINTNPPTSYSYQRMTRQSAQQQLGIGSMGLYVSFWSGQSMVTDWNVSQKVESALRCSKRPWDGFDELFTNFANISPQFARSTNIRVIEIIAPVAVWIAKAAIQEDNKLRVEVEASPAISADDVALSVIGYFEGNSQERTQTETRTVIDTTHFSFEVSFPKRILLAKAILVYHNLDVDRVELLGKARTDVNPRLAILQNVKLENFLKSLRDEKDERGKKDRRFEERVAILLHVLGLSPGYYGSTYQDNADILAFPDSNEWVLVVECTAEEPSLHDHLIKLSRRTKDIRDAMRNVQVHPVIVTKLARARLNEVEKDTARKERISVVTSDDLEALLRMALEGVSQAKVLERIVELIPGERGALGSSNLIV